MKLFYPLLTIFLIGCASDTTYTLPVTNDKEINLPEINHVLSEVTIKTTEVNESLAVKAIANEVRGKEIIKTSDVKIKSNSVDVKDWRLTKIEAELIVNDSIEQQKLIKESKEVLDKAVKINYNLLLLKKYLEEIEKDNTEILEADKKLRKEIQKVREENAMIKKDFTKKSEWIWIIGIGFSAVALILGVVMVIKGMVKTGYTLVLASLILIPLFMFIGTYPVIVAIAGGVIFFGIVGVALYEFFTHRSALIETVKGVEEFKKKNSRGWQDAKDKLNEAHSTNTKKLLNDVKHKIL